MRRLTTLLAACLVLLVPAGAQAASARARPRSVAAASLSSALNRGMALVGSSSGAYVEDLTTGAPLYADNAHVGRLPASVEKLYTTSTVLLKFGPAARLSTQVLATGQLDGSTFTGTLYLRGGGDPTFGSAGFIQANYGSGASVGQLIANLVRATGMRSFHGSVVADESMLDSLRGTPPYGYQPSIDVEGELSALAFNRGWADAYGTVYYKHPAVEAGQQFVQALKTAGVHVPGTTAVRAGLTPATATPLAAVASPRMSTLVDLTNTPSDNFFAETLLKDLGARYGTGGTTADGAAVVRSTIAARFGLYPQFNDGSGLSRYDHTSPFDVVSLLRQQASNSTFVNSLAVAGRTGTLKDEMGHTFARGRCQGKTGTLSNASNLVGYCRARDGHTLAFAFLMNRIYPGFAHPIQDAMVTAVARYDGQVVLSPSR
jgi:D-alanyl-D-alanine carboxypeptidase/D-alanyl-D-alanine-endopeptidase (penicillin-binding protein 4)